MSYLCGVTRPFPQLASRLQGTHVGQRFRWRHPLSLSCCRVLGSRFWVLALMVAVRNPFFPLQLGLSCAAVSHHTSSCHELLSVFCPVSPHLRRRHGHAGFGDITVSRGWGRRRGAGGGRVSAQKVRGHVLPLLVFVLLEKGTAQQHRRGLFIRGVGGVIVGGAKRWGRDGTGGRRRGRRWGEADGETWEKTTTAVGCDCCTSSTCFSILTIILIILVQLRVGARAVAWVVQTVIPSLDSKASWQKIFSQWSTL